jgi:hypothetical protein
VSTTQIKDGFNGGSDNQLKVNSDGSINVNSSGGGGGGGGDVNIFDSAGNPLTSTSGALNVSTTGSSTVSGTVTSNTAGLTAFQTSQYSIGTSAVQLAPTPLSNRSSLSITIIAAINTPVYIGNSSSVTSSNGYPLYNGSTMQLDLTPAGEVWAISTQATQTAAILEIA